MRFFLHVVGAACMHTKSWSAPLRSAGALVLLLNNNGSHKTRNSSGKKSQIDHRRLGAAHAQISIDVQSDGQFVAQQW